MIKSLKIQNFQSHEKTELNFSDGVNVIIGPSDSGKSAIIRALRWLVWNRPSGNSFRSYWDGQTFVKLVTEDNIIRRIKDKTDSYTLVTPNGKKFTFKAIGTSVPEEIKSVLNINEVNLQQQLDSPFILSKSAGEVAQHFNKVARLDMIDKATSNVNSAIRELEQNIKHKIADIKKQKEQLKTFNYLGKMEAEVEVLEEINKQFKILTKNTDKLQELIYDIQLIKSDIRDKLPLLALEKQVDSLIKDINISVKKDKKLIKLKSLVDNIKEVQNDIEQQKQLLKLETPVNTLLNLYEDKREVDEKHKQLYKLLYSIEQNNMLINIAKQKYKDLYAKFNNEMGDVCILCGQIIKR